MVRRNPREARVLGLWSASWLAALLVAGLVWLGDLTLQWPVLLVPALWALVALRRRPDHRRPLPDETYGYDGAADDLGRGARVAERTDTVERPAVRPRGGRRDRGR